MGPKLQKERLRQIEALKTAQREKQQEILDEKRNPSVEAVASISQEEDPSTMKQPSRWQGAITMVVNINRMSRKERADKIDEIIKQQGKDKEIEKILERVNRTPTGNFNNLDEIELLKLIEDCKDIEDICFLCKKKSKYMIGPINYQATNNTNAYIHLDCIINNNDFQKYNPSKKLNIEKTIIEIIEVLHAGFENEKILN